MTHRYGLYRATVTNNVDPLQIGRVMVEVPEAPDMTPSTWAMPCAPLAGDGMGLFVVPPVGAGVWVQFEAGHVDRPVWMGGWWANAGQIPALALATDERVPGDPGIVMQTLLQNAVVLNDAPGPSGGVMLKSAAGATVIVNDTGIFIDNGQGARLSLVGPVVSVNDGALEVT